MLVFWWLPGKVGAIVGLRVKGQDIIIGHHNESTKEPIKSNRIINEKFKLLTSFFKAIALAVNMGFKDSARGKRPLNVAYYYNYDHAFVAADDHLLNYSKMVYSRGHIAPSESVNVVLESSLEEPSGSQVRCIKFSWSPQG